MECSPAMQIPVYKPAEGTFYLHLECKMGSSPVIWSLWQDDGLTRWAPFFFWSAPVWRILLKRSIPNSTGPVIQYYKHPFHHYHGTIYNNASQRLEWKQVGRHTHDVQADEAQTIMPWDISRYNQRGTPVEHKYRYQQGNQNAPSIRLMQYCMRSIFNKIPVNDRNKERSWCLPAV